MVPNWFRLGLLGAGLAFSCLGCLGSKGYRTTLTLGPEGANAPVQELPPKDSAYVCLITAQEFEKAGRVPEAISLYEKARSLQPVLDKKLSRRLAVLYDQVGDFTKADEEYSKTLAQHPKDADLFNDLGYSHYTRGDWAAAEEQLTRAVELNPRHKRAWINLGMAIAQQERYPESMRAFRRAVSEAEALCNLGFVLSVQGKKDKALEAYSRAAEQSPSLRLAQAAVNRYNNPEPIKSERTAKEPRVESRTLPSPYGAMSSQPARLPLSTRVVDDAPLIIDPDFDSLPSSPKMTK